MFTYAKLEVWFLASFNSCNAHFCRSYRVVETELFVTILETFLGHVLASLFFMLEGRAGFKFFA